MLRFKLNIQDSSFALFHHLSHINIYWHKDVSCENLYIIKHQKHLPAVKYELKLNALNL